jgi:hypothetical protein
VDTVGFQGIRDGLKVKQIGPTGADRLLGLAIYKYWPRILNLFDKQLMIEIKVYSRGSPRLITGHGEGSGF